MFAEQNPHLDGRERGREEEGKVDAMREFFAHFEIYWYRGLVSPQDNVKSYLCLKCCT